MDPLSHCCLDNRTQLLVSRDGVAIKTPNSQTVFDINLLLMAADFCTSRDLMLSLSTCNDPVMKSHILPSETLKKLYSSLDSVLASVGNKGYSIVKYLEPICLSQILMQQHREDPGAVDLRFPNRTWDEIKNLECELRCEISTPLKELLEELNPIQLLEVFGLFRHWGHPIIEVELGLSKLLTHTRSVKVVNQQLMSRLASEMSRILLHNYFNRCLGWPPNNICPPGTSRILEDCIIENRWPSKREMTLIPQIWNLIQHPKLIDDIGNIPVVELLADKAHSVGLSELEKLCQDGVVTATTCFTRRVLLSAIKTESINLIKFLDEIDKEGLTKEDLVIGLKAKERKVKPEGRFFSFMTFRLRLYFVTTEWLLTTYIMPLFREITMTYSQVNLLEIFSDITKSGRRHDTAAFMIHLD